MTFPNIPLLRCTAEAAQNNKLFTRAVTLQEKSLKSTNQPDLDALIEALNLYQTAFESGLPEAGINMLFLLVSSMIVSKNVNVPTQYRYKVMDIIMLLDSVDNPAGAYYLAVCLINDLLNTGKPIDANFKQGLRLLDALSSEGYEPATKYIDQLYAECCDE